MKTRVCTALMAAGLTAAAWGQTPLGTAFTYQGQLKESGRPADGDSIMEFRLYDDPAAGSQVGPTLVFDGLGDNPQPVRVVGGLFTVGLDFGDVLTGQALWLEITVNSTPLAPRQPVTPAPMALALPALRTQVNVTSPNIVAGHPTNVVGDGVVGATLSGGGNDFGSNSVRGDYGTIGGGAGNVAGSETSASGLPAQFATVGGGKNNTASDWTATVAGGHFNTASHSSAFVGGGFSNTASFFDSAVVAGVSNVSEGSGSLVGAGNNNRASGHQSFIGSGIFNTAKGAQSVVPGGASNSAGGNFSLAAGHRAKVRSPLDTGDSDGDEGSFVWADTTEADFTSTGPNQFLIRASGGVGVNTSTPATPLHVAGGSDVSLAGGGFVVAGAVNSTNLAFDNNELMARNNGAASALFLNNDGGPVIIGGSASGTALGIGIFPNQTLHIAQNGSPIVKIQDSGTGGATYHLGISSSDASFRIARTGVADRIVIKDDGKIGIGTSVPDQLLTVNGGASKPGGGSWSVFSDARLKKNIRNLEGALDSLLALRGVVFEYIDAGAINERPGERIGMIAQEVEPVFPDWVDESDDGLKHLTFRGFEALAVEALRGLRTEKDAEMTALRAEMDMQIAQRDADIAALKARLERLERILGSDAIGQEKPPR